MKKIARITSIILIAAMLLAGCAQAAPATQEATKPLKIAIVSPSTINDLAFTQSIYDAMVVLQKEMGADKLEKRKGRGR